MTNQHGSVVVNESDHILHIRLNRPEAGNALDWCTFEGLHAAFTRLNEDDGVWAAVLTGAGHKTFCAGADLKSLPRQVAEKRQQGISLPDTIMHGLRVSKPVLCVLNGAAYGGGVELAIACDMRIAAEHAQLTLPEARVGMIPAGGATYRLPQLIGRGRALRMMFSGEAVSATQAYDWGLVDRVVPQTALADATTEWVTSILGSAPLALQAIKELVNASSGTNGDLLEAEATAIARIQRTADAAEGTRAFLERRAPAWCGR